MIYYNLIVSVFFKNAFSFIGKQILFQKNNIKMNMFCIYKTCSKYDYKSCKFFFLQKKNKKNE